MSRLLAVMAIVIVAVVIFRNRSEEPPAGYVERRATPEEELRALIDRDPIEAARLASIAEAHPRIATSLLKNRLINLTGVVESFKVTSIDRKVLRMRLQGTPRMRVCLTFDLKRYNTTQTYSMSDGTYEVVGHEVLYFPGLTEKGEGISRRGVARGESDKPAKVIHRTGENIRVRCRFDRIEAGEIHFSAE